MIYRYELYANGEYQNIGFIWGMHGEFNPDEIDKLCLEFNKKLRIPPYHKIKANTTCAFFTEKGKNRFSDEIQSIIDAYHEETLFTVKCLTIDDSLIRIDDILYCDAYQMLIKQDIADKFRSKTSI